MRGLFRTGGRWCDAQVWQRRPFDDLQGPFELARHPVEHEPPTGIEGLRGADDRLKPTEVTEQQAAQIEVNVAGRGRQAGEGSRHRPNVGRLDISYQRDA